MKFHLILPFVFAILISENSYATTLTASMANVSNAVSNGVTTVYYLSDIGDTGSGCNKALNPKCHALTEAPTISVYDDTTAALPVTTKAYVYVSSGNSTPPPQGSLSLASGGNILGSVAYTAGQTTVPITNVTYSQICGGYGDTTCGTAEGNPITIYLILDNNGDGIFNTGDDSTSVTLYVKSSIPSLSDALTKVGLYGFLAFPGDEEIHVKNLQAESTFPLTTNTIGIQYARFYYAQTTDPTTVTTTGFHKDTTVGSDGTLTDSYITGLTNGMSYCVLPALIDNAGNIGYVFNTGDGTAATMCTSPDQIIGLLSQNGQCFIATAAYGSNMESHVQTLRNFRDKFLMPTELGRNFVSWYYKHSPKWAAKIRQNNTERAVVRTFLWPVVGYSHLALKWGATNASLFAAIILLMPLLLIQLAIFQKRKKRNEV